MRSTKRVFIPITPGAGSTPVGSLTAEQAGTDAADLRAAIGELAGLVAGSLGLPELLAEVALSRCTRSRAQRVPG